MTIIDMTPSNLKIWILVVDHEQCLAADILVIAVLCHLRVWVEETREEVMPTQVLQKAPALGSQTSYSSTGSYESDDTDTTDYRNGRHRSKNTESSASNYTGRFYPDPIESMNGLQSNISKDTATTDTTLTNNDIKGKNIDELADYFNKRLEDMQRQASQMEGPRRRNRSQYPDDLTSNYSYQHRDETDEDSVRSFDHGRTIRPTNRAISGMSDMTPTNSENHMMPTESGSRISSVQDEIETLRSQISRDLDSKSSGRNTEDLANYFSKRLEECQQQVYSAVNNVQSHVGHVRSSVADSSVQSSRPRHRRRHDYNGRDDDYDDSSDSGIGPRNLTIRPMTRAQAREAQERAGSRRSDIPPDPPSRMASNMSPVPRSRQVDHDDDDDDDDTYVGSRFESHQPPLPPYEDRMESQNVLQTKSDLTQFNGAVDCDEEEEWDDFVEFIDDDTPAPEASIPVPKVGKKLNNYGYQFVYVAYLLSFLAYVFVRIQFTLDAPGLNRIYCIVVASLEIITAPSLILQGLCLWRWVSRDDPPTNAFVRPKFHTARIMVPTYKEPLEVVAGTVHEIIHMELPPGLHVHVYVLDDGRRENLENWVLSKRTKRRMYLHYVARPKLPGVPHHAKAGNINHTLHFIFDDCCTEGECVIIFDADFMPRRNYLMRVLPVFSSKRTRPLGLVQTPQFFYNVNPDEDVWDHLNVSFFHRIEPSLDRWSAVNCCGTNFTVRADALKDVGYFPVGCLTEDTLLSLRLCTMGWGVSYHHEVLAIGQSPHEITEIFKQRSRWCKGNLQIFLDEFPLMQSGLSLSQRLFYSSCGFNYFCASISIPFFQLVPSWAIFFGLWPVSKIGLEFAFAFFIYYILGNILLLFPPPRFGVKDMWNGELASTNLWFTYFNGVRRIVGTKLLKGKGELTFKTTKKKAEGEEEDSAVGFRKEDVRACYMHFIMFFLMFVTIIYAIIKAVIATDVKFYFYYMYMIGMSWALINMVPYLIVVIYCWYRVKIPGLMVACFRNIQLLLRIVCAALILVQAFTTRNLTENYICPTDYAAQLGKSPMTMVKTLDDSSGLEVNRNAFWLLGLKDDFYTMQQIKQSSCEDETVPVIVLFMHPSQGLALDAEAGHYMPEDRIGTWEEYDEKLDYYAEHLSEIPSLIVMEPSLLMHTFNSKTEYHNTPYQMAFAQRVERVVNLFSRSWIYVDSGNAMYLQWTVNLDHIISVLKQMPATIRGFTINVGSFVNSSYNELLAEEIHCQTGLHYLVDTSRNGGDFSRRSLDDINECTYDPPEVGKGEIPSWATGAGVTLLAGQRALASIPVQTEVEAPETANTETESEYYDYENYQIGKKRKKRWELDAPPAGGPIFAEDSPAAGGQQPNAGNTGGGGGNRGGGGKVLGGGSVAADDSYAYTDGVDYYGYDGDSAVAKACVSKEGETGLDGYAWIKTPGESDGRLFNSGTYHPCLLGHPIECTETCPQYIPKLNGEFQRQESCGCKDE
uniref:Cellulose synthase n=1 Tax=Molgula tectiformis TaxID=30286 RepID=E7FJ00_MOLTE|nr:cellulose synthase [Molgula tectiformis]